jgi:predicted RNase H-like HicB family nuclease
MKPKRKFSAIIHKEGKWYVSLCPELDVASQGKTVEEAVENLREAVNLYRAGGC